MKFAGDALIVLYNWGNGISEDDRKPFHNGEFSPSFLCSVEDAAICRYTSNSAVISVAHIDLPRLTPSTTPVHGSQQLLQVCINRAFANVDVSSSSGSSSNHTNVHIGLSLGNLTSMSVGGIENRWEHVVAGKVLSDVSDNSNTFFMDDN